MMTISQNFVARLAIVRPIAMLVIFITIFVLGLISVVKIPLEMIPSAFESKSLTVSVNYPNAGAYENEEKVCVPLADSFADLPNIVDTQVVSSRDDCRVELEFKKDADMDRAYREVRDRIARVKSQLPSEIRAVPIFRMSAANFPIAFWGITWDPGVEVPYDKINRIILPRIERVPGVGRVQLMGEGDREILIELDRERVDSANLDVSALVGRLQQSHFTLASGQVVDGDSRALLRSVAEFSSKEELEELQIDKTGLRLRDVANLRYDYPESTSVDVVNGRDSHAVMIMRESTANTREVCKLVREEFARLGKDGSLQGMQFVSFFDQSDNIDNSLSQVLQNGAQGGILAVVVLLFFLQRLRMTVVIASSIPLSILMAMPFMYFGGRSINLISMIGLMICTGLVVDNAVVVAENIDRWRRLGMGKWVAALHGTGEVALPVLLATATTVVVFLPSALLSAGTVQLMLLELVTPICVSLAGSLFFAFVLTPMAAVHLLEIDWRSGLQSRPWLRWIVRLDAMSKHWLARGYDLVVLRLERYYAVVLRWAMSHRMDVGMICLLALASLVVPLNPERGLFSRLSMDMDGRQVRVHIDPPPEASIEEIREFVLASSTWLRKNGEQFELDGDYVHGEEGSVRLNAFLLPASAKSKPMPEVSQEILDALPVPVGWQKSLQKRGQSDDDTSHRVQIFGETHESVLAVRKNLVRRILELPGVVGLAREGEERAAQEELALRVDPVLSQRLGWTAQGIGQFVGAVVRGVDLPRFRGTNGEIPVRLRYEKEDREQVDKLLQFQMRTATGSVPLGVMVTPAVTRSEDKLVRRNRRVVSELAIDIKKEEAEKVREAISELLKEYPRPAGVSFDDGEALRELKEQNLEMLGGAVLGGVFIYLIMCFLFESFILPLSVLPSIPLSLVGVGWTLYFAGGNIDPLAFVGLLLLMGIVVNNAIVLIDFVNVGRARGMQRAQAIVHAGEARFRPILMTSLTTVGGLLPLAIAQGGGEGISYRTFAQTLVGGMASSTVLTLVIVPVAYTVLDDIRIATGAWFRMRLAATESVQK